MWHQADEGFPPLQILERDLQDLSLTKHEGGVASFGLDFRGFEIKTVKLTLASASAAKARK